MLPEDGTDALRRLEHWSPDVIVLDLGLPQMNGRDLYPELRAGRDTRRILIVIVSGMDTRDLNAADFAAILQKPVDANRLLDAVNDATQLRRDAASS